MSKRKRPDTIGKSIQTPKKTARDLQIAIQYGRIEDVKNILKRHPELVHEIVGGLSPLHQAISEVNMLSNSPFPTPGNKQKFMEIIKTLMKSGANIHLRSTGYTALKVPEFQRHVTPLQMVHEYEDDQVSELYKLLTKNYLGSNVSKILMKKLASDGNQGRDISRQFRKDFDLRGGKRTPRKPRKRTKRKPRKRTKRKSRKRTKRKSRKRTKHKSRKRTPRKSRKRTKRESRKKTKRKSRKKTKRKSRKR